MEAEWKGVNLEIVEYRETQTYVLKGFDEIQQLLDDHIVMTQSMSFSPFKGPFAQRIDEWEKLLVLMSDIFEEWLKCQRSWMSLRAPIGCGVAFSLKFLISRKCFSTNR